MPIYVVLSNFTAQPVPEPGSVFALCAAAGAIGAWARRRRVASSSPAKVVS